MKLRLIAVAAALGVCLAPGSSSIAIAQEKADKGAAPAKPAEAVITAEVVVLHGTNDKTGIDAKIGKMPELEKPPFSSYDSYKLLDRVKLEFTKGKAATVKLPNGRDLMVSLKDIIEPKKKDEQKKYVVSASIQKKTGDAFLPLLEVNAKAGETFFVAGQSYKGGVLVIGIRLNP
jgi:hypothetical protein